MRGRKILSLILTLTMWLGVMPSSVNAEETAVTFTALAGTDGVNDEEDYDKLLDGKKTEANGSKWGVANFESAYIIICASEPVVVTGYTFTTGNDNTTAKLRNPKDWTLYGCNDYDTSDSSSGTWTVIHNVTNDTTMQDVNYTPYTFTFENDTAYTYYKLLITANRGSSFMQISEMEFICNAPDEKIYVTFDKNGGDTDPVPTQMEYKSGLPSTNPTRNGYAFDGWYTKNGADGDRGEQFTAETVLTKDTTVYAKWQEYTINYDLNDGSGQSFAELGYGSGLPGIVPTRDGFRFVGWYTKNGADGDCGEKFTSASAVSANMTVYAKWTEPVEFEIIDGTQGNTSGSYNEVYENLFDGNNSGSTFTKWCVHGTAGYLIIKAEKPIILDSYTFITGNDNAEHNGRNPKSWSIAGCNDYNSEDSTSGTWEQIAAVTDDTTIKDVNFTAYTFAANADKAYMYYKLDITKNGGNDLLQLCGLDFGYYVPDEYTGTLVFFDKNGGDTMAFPQVIACGGGLPSTNPTKNGYAFDGWYTKNGADGDLGEQFTAEMVFAEDTTVYAKWQEYTITYSMNDGSGGNHAVLDYGMTPEIPSKSGRDFEGWYTKDGAGGDWGEPFTAQTVISGDTTVYAKWGNLKIIFDKNGGDTEPVPAQMEYQSGLPSTNPTRNGYAFDGWYTKNGADDDWGEQYGTDTVFTENSTVYAKWRDYNITFKMNDGSDTDYATIGYAKAFPLPVPKKKNASVSAWYTRNGVGDDWGSLFTKDTAVEEDIAVYAKWEESHTHCICGDEHTSVGDHSSEELATFEPIGTSQELLNMENGTETEPRYYYLTADIAVPRDTNSTGWWVFVKKNVVLCLNGHTLSHETRGAVIEVTSGDFTLTDCKGTGTVTHSNQEENNSGVYVNGGTFNMYGGKITKNVAGVYGGGVKVYSGTFNMYGGQIAENSASSEYDGGGGVYVNDSTFNMYGGKISGNTTSGQGGGVYLGNSKGKINILGGEISANSASKRGGGIYCSEGDLKVENAEIKKNMSDSGGGIFLSSYRIFSIKNSRVTENNASDGGGIYSWSSGDEITGCEITGNTASNDGGGIYTRSDTSLKIENSTISQNTATEKGGAVCTYTKAIIKNTSISGNKAANGGGLAFWVSHSDNESTLEACTIENNEATGNGGGVNICDGIVNMTGGTAISNNTAQNGGGVYFDGDGLNMQRLNVLGNTAKTNGGGMYVKKQNAVTANGGVYIYGNTLANADDNAEETESEETGAPSNLYLAKYYSSYLSHIKLTAATLETEDGSLDTKIGITLENTKEAFTDETETDYSGCFVYDDIAYAVVYKDKVLKLADAYVVTFDLGDYIEKVAVAQNKPVSEPDYEPYMEGKTFIGWFVDDKEWDFSTPVTANTTISSRWFEENNASVGITSDKVYVSVPTSGAVLYLVLYKNYIKTDTIRKNVEADTVFDMEELGIDTDSTDTVSAVLLDADDNPITQEVRVVLRIPVFDVSFNRNGGDSDPAPKTLKSDEGLPTTAPTKAGYTFGGWYTKNGTNRDWGEEYTSNYVVKSNLTVYAKWKKNLGSVGFAVLYSTGDSGSGENAAKLVDGRKTAANGTKWCVTDDFSDSGSGVYAVLKAEEDIKVTGYTLTTGNDSKEYSERNPKSWKIYGCNDYNTSTREGAWTEIASVTGDTLLPAENYASAHYDIIGNETNYIYYKFEVSATESGTMMQLAELEFDYEECDHSWDFVELSEATCLEKGYETRKCALCGKEEITVISPAFGHGSDENGNCPRCGKLAEAEVGGVKYSDLKNAVAAIENVGGTVKLLKNVEIDGGIKITQDAEITLDLNGYVLRTVNDERAVKMENGTLNITDSRPNTVNKLNTSSTPWEPAEADANGDNIKAYSGGIITGGGVKLNNSSKGLNMSGGSFVGCRINSYGGAIYSDGVLVVMSGNATIRDCRASSTGHAVNILNADFTMNDNAAIYDCGYDLSYSDYGGSAVNSSGDNVTLNGASSIRKGNAKYSYGIDNSSKKSTVHANTSGTVEGNLYVKKIMSDEGCENTTIFTGYITADSVSAGLFYGTVNATIENCKVVYKKSNASNAATYATNVVKSGSKAFRPTDPTEDGKRFIGWKNGDTAYNFDAAVTSDVTLTADWLTGEVDSAEKFRQALEYKLTPIKFTADITLNSSIDVSYPLVIDLNGYVLKYEGEDDDPYIFNVSENNELTLTSTNSNREHRFDTSNSLWTPADDSATGDKIVTMYGGIVIGSVKNDGVFNMTGGIFVSCDGGENGVVNNGGTFTMTGGSFVGCTGTAVKNSDTFIMNNGYIVSYDLSGAALVNSGAMYVKYGVIYAAVNNSGTISAGESVGKFSVYKNVANTGTITTGLYYGGITNSADGKTVGCRLSFMSDGTEYAFELLPCGNTAFMPDDPEKDDYGFVGWYKNAGCTEEWDFDDDTVIEDTVLYAKWMSGEVSTAKELHAAADTGVGNIKLTADIEIDEAVCIYDTTTIDLNGHVLKFVSEDDYCDSVIYVSDEGKLTIKDSNPTAEHKFDTSNALWVLAADTATGDNIKTVYGGVITGGMGYAGSDGALHGGGIENYGELEIFGGNIVGCSATCGGGIYNAGELIINDVYIAGCTVADLGNEDESDYEESYGGGICNSGEFEMVGGLVEYCGSEYCGGGIFNSSILIMSDGAVKNCSTEYGGGICNGGMLAMVGGAVEACAATEMGGGVYNYGYFVMNALIKNNQSETGADVYNYYYLNAVGGKIEGEVYNAYKIYCDYTEIDSLEGISCEDVTVFGGKVTNTCEIYDGIYYGKIENITVIDGEDTYTGTIAAPAVTYTNGSEVYAVYVTSRKDFAIVPIEPVKSGSSFEGWYNGNERYGFNESITGNLTLTAKWNGEAVNPSLTIASNEVSVNIAAENATLYVSVYKNNKLVGVALKKLTASGSVTLSSLGLDTSAADTIKAYLWDDNMHPLCAPAEASLQ